MIMKATCTIVIITLVTSLIHLCQGQAVIEFPDGPTNSSTPTPSPTLITTTQPSVISTTELRMCRSDDKLSKAHCVCNEKVVSCDFSTFSSNNTIVNGSSKGQAGDIKHEGVFTDHLELILYGYQLPAATSRVCLCNAPSNLHLTFPQNDFLPYSTNTIHRFDLFNLSGVTHFAGGFNVNFHGDLYIANVTQIAEIKAYEFGRGNDKPVENVQDIECCSPIKVNQLHKKPLLFIENSTIGTIRSRGIDDSHLWKTLILNCDVFNNVETNGISFNSRIDDLNVALLGGKFRNVSHDAIMLEHAVSIFLTKNTFTHSDNVNSLNFGSRSTLNDSVILLMDNVFWNEIYLRLDARHIISWYNLFDLWDMTTFAEMINTSFSSKTSQIINEHQASDRSVSFKYNIVSWVELLNNSINFGNDSNATLSDNVLGSCNCSRFVNITDKALNPKINWCYVGSVRRADGNCSLRLDSAMKLCAESKSVNFNDFCKDKIMAVPQFPGINANLTGNVNKMEINSTFILRIVEDFRAMFGVNRIKKIKGLISGNEISNSIPSQNEESSEADSTTTSTSKGTSAKKSAVVPVVVTMAVVIVVAVVVIFAYRYRHKLLRRSGHQELVDEGSRNEMI